MALQLATLANSIAALTVAGLTIKDIDEIPAEVGARLHVLFPAAEYVTDFSMQRDSFGSGATAKMTVTYTLNYVLCYTPAGAGRAGVIEYYENMIAMAMAFIDAVLAIVTITGSIDVIPIAVSNMGIVQDPAGTDYIGCYISLQCQEFVN